MIVVNFAHPLTDAQRAQIEEKAGEGIEQVIDVPARFDDSQPFGEQVSDLVAATGLSAVDWQTRRLLINLPGFGSIVAVLLAHLHGLTGHFPTVIRLRTVAERGPATFEVAELMHLHAVRVRAREER